MQHVVSITSQGQLSIPKSILKRLGITTATKATLTETKSGLIVEPRTDFWSLAGALKGKVKLTDKQLQEARKKFQSDWANV